MAKRVSQRVSSARDVKKALAALGTPERAKRSAGFFKTGAGEYSEKDKFIGVTVPEQRLVAKANEDFPFQDLHTLLQSPVHEERLTALIILVARYERGDVAEKKRCFDFYLAHLAAVNNWDLVDSSAPQIVGMHLRSADRKLLYRLARSKDLWQRRVAIVGTQALINAGESADTFAIADLLLGDTHDLIHKAVGWMLREVGKRVSETELRRYLEKNITRLPRTALRYAIERFPPAERKEWLARK